MPADLPDIQAEWLEPDGLGGFASGTVGGQRTRRYHALLLAATRPPTGRIVLVNGLEAWVETDHGTVALSTQRYAPDVVYPDGHSRLIAFACEPWPEWTFQLPNGARLTQEIVTVHGRPETVLRWVYRGDGRASLRVRPLLSGRDYHALHRENTNFRFDAEMHRAAVCWRPYDGVPGVTAISNGEYRHDPDWYRNFIYTDERDRGLDSIEDLASPGVFRWKLDEAEAVLAFRANGSLAAKRIGNDPLDYARQTFSREGKRRREFASPLLRAADAYIVNRGDGKTVVAGYPWFTDWGRDTFIAMRGLCIAAGRLDVAEDILLAWADTVSEGMLPNRFPDSGESPEFNSVDASLWYVVAAHEYLSACERSGRPANSRTVEKLRIAVCAIVEGYARGTRFNIRKDADGLLAAGVAGVQLTWMDAKVGDWVVTPRIGKPVEVQALWINALRVAGTFERHWAGEADRATAAFRDRFWREDAGCLYDVIDVDHERGRTDSAFRPNQIFAVGGLPFAMLDGDRARRVVDAVEAQLLTPLGLRSLSPNEPDYSPRYEGGVWERDAAYHQGTVWPWLMGPFVEAWLRVRGGSAAAKAEARQRFVQPLLDHLATAGLGHISEIADAEPPHTPRGCPFQAWSLGELLRTISLLSDEGVDDERPRHTTPVIVPA